MPADQQPDQDPRRRQPCEPGTCWAEPLIIVADDLEAERDGLRAENERLRDLAELAVTACLPLLPLKGSWTTGYVVEQKIEHTLRALPEEWAGAAYHVGLLHAAIEGLPETPLPVDEVHAAPEETT